MLSAKIRSIFNISGIRFFNARFNNSPKPLKDEYENLYKTKYLNKSTNQTDAKNLALETQKVLSELASKYPKNKPELNYRTHRPIIIKNHCTLPDEAIEEKLKILRNPLEKYINVTENTKICTYSYPTKSHKILGTVCLLPGYGDHINGLYKKLANLLTEKSVDVIGFDYRGFGKSQGQRRLLENFDILEQDFLKVYKEQNIKKPFILLGNCIGSLIAIYIAMKNPNLINGQILINPYFGAIQRTKVRSGFSKFLQKLVSEKLGIKEVDSFPFGLIGTNKNCINHILNDPLFEKDNMLYFF